MIGVDDPDLGPQGIGVYGDLPVDMKVPVLCLTSAGRCVSTDVVKERLDMWPLTPVTLCASISLTMAALALGLGARRARRRRATREHAAPAKIG